MTTNGGRKERTRRGCLMCRLRRKLCKPPVCDRGPCQHCSDLHIKCPEGYGVRRPSTMKEFGSTASKIKEIVKKRTTQMRSKRGRELIGDNKLDLLDLIWPQDSGAPASSPAAPIPVLNRSPTSHSPIPRLLGANSTAQSPVDPGSLPAQQDRISGITSLFPPAPPRTAEAVPGDTVSMDIWQPAEIHVSSEGPFPSSLQTDLQGLGVNAPKRPLSPMRFNMLLWPGRTVNPRALSMQLSRGTHNDCEAPPTAGSSNAYGNWRYDNLGRD